jgi:hypothetical protein
MEQIQAPMSVARGGEMKSSRDGSRLASLIALCILLLLAGMYCGGDDGKSFAPSVELVDCPPDTVCEGVPCVFSWEGVDRDGHVEGYYHGLNDETPGDWTSCEGCTLACAPIGRNVFYVLAVDDDGNSSGAASCAFTVVESGCMTDPRTLDFGTVAVGSDSAMSFTVINYGGITVTGSIAGACGDFSITDGGGHFSLDEGESREVSVRFSPGACGVSECSVSAGGACPAVDCRGVGGGVACSMTPLGLDFGPVALGESEDLTFTIASNGCEPLAGALTESSGDYAILGGGSYSLAPGEEKTVTVRFTPSSCGPSSCAVDAGNGACAAVSCSGEGVGPWCEVSPAVIDFGDVGRGRETMRSFWIRNSGCVPLEGTISESCAPFSIESSPSWYLSPGESTEVSVKLAPLSCDEETSCWISTGDPRADSVFCTAIVRCGCWVSDSDMFHDFGCVDPDQSRNKDFYITNLGDDTLSLYIRFKRGCDAGFYFNMGAGHQVIAPDEEHQIVVRFSPGDDASYECTLDLGECGEIRLVGSRCGVEDPPLPTADPKCRR